MNNKEIARQALEQASEEELAEILQQSQKVNSTLWKLQRQRELQQKRDATSAQLAELTDDQRQGINAELTSWAIEHARSLYGEDAIERVSHSRNFEDRYDSLP